MTALMSSQWWSSLGSTLASFMFLWAIVRQYVPHQLQDYLTTKTAKFFAFVSPYVRITFPEYPGERFRRSEAYIAIESYLSAACSENARRLKADMGKDGASLVLSMDDHEDVTDVFRGASFLWSSRTNHAETPVEERRYYQLTFHRRQRRLVVNEYLRHVMEEGKVTVAKRRQRKLYTNNSSSNYWNHVPFEHPATFDNLAMDPEKKKGIIRDLNNFTKSKDYYKRIGKPWKRGYLLDGPPGTGKSTMVAAMANLLDYDVYDLELTAVKNNTALRKLLIETTAKSIIVIEDIDCSLDLAGKRKAEGKEEEESKKMVGREDKEESKVTLSGLLNFIDGLWSACGGERLLVFTTNHVEKLDPALIRRGRMDVHVLLSYCDFEGFKVLARNYLGIDEHPMFERIRLMMGEVEITPADVAENLMAKSVDSIEKNVETCLKSLLLAMEECKAKAKAKKVEGEVEITPADVAENLMAKSVDSIEKNVETCLKSLLLAMEECKAKAKAKKVEEALASKTKAIEEEALAAKTKAAEVDEGKELQQN